jgi:hypothetical protein
MFLPQSDAQPTLLHPSCMDRASSTRRTRGRGRPRSGPAACGRPAGEEKPQLAEQGVTRRCGRRPGVTGTTPTSHSALPMHSDSMHIHALVIAHRHAWHQRLQSLHVAVHHPLPPLPSALRPHPQQQQHGRRVPCVGLALCEELPPNPHRVQGTRKRKVNPAVVESEGHWEGARPWPHPQPWSLWQFFSQTPYHPLLPDPSGVLVPHSPLALALRASCLVTSSSLSSLSMVTS